MNKQNKPLVSIITLNYNSNFLLQTIYSVLQQNYPSIEYIIVDDGSENFSKPEIEKFIQKNNHGNIKKCVIIDNKINIGTVKEYNKANSIAKGEIIFNISSDDVFLDNNVITDWVNHFFENGCDISTALREVYDETLTKLIKILPSKKDMKAIKHYSNKKLFRYNERHNIVLGCCTAKTKKCLNTVGPINEIYRLIEDYPFIMSALRKNQKISLFDRKVIKYRSNGNSAAINLNDAYLNDTDKIFKNEIMPYSQNTRLCYKKYRNWVKSAMIGKKYWEIKKLYVESKISFLELVRKLIFLSLRHPVIITKKIFNRC